MFSCLSSSISFLQCSYAVFTPASMCSLSEFVCRNYVVVESIGKSEVFELVYACLALKVTEEMCLLEEGVGVTTSSYTQRFEVGLLQKN